MRRLPIEPNTASVAVLALPSIGLTRTVRNRMMATRKPRFYQADLERLFRAAKSAGLRDYRIDIALDGRLSLIVGGNAATAPADSEWDEVLAERPPTSSFPPRSEWREVKPRKR